MPKDNDIYLNVTKTRLEEKVPGRVAAAMASAVDRPDITKGKIDDAHSAVIHAIMYVLSL